MLKGEGQETNGLSKDEIQETNDSNIPMGQMGCKKSIKNQIVYCHPNGLYLVTAGKYFIFLTVVSLKVMFDKYIVCIGVAQPKITESML